MQRLVVALVFGAMVMHAQQPAASSSAPRAGQAASLQQVKEQAIVIPQGSTVEVRLLNGQKLRGRIGSVSDEGIALRSVFDNKIEERTISFADIKSVRYYSPLMPSMARTYILMIASTAASIAIAATR